MIRANIYSIEPLLPEVRGAVEDGIGMVAAYMGQSVVAKELRVRLPLNGAGVVRAERVGFGKLDKMVELHLMAVPLDPGEDERIGLAGIGRGWSFVDTSRRSIGLIRTTAAHETGHALGFVLPGSPQEDPESSYHCCDQSCIMHKRALMVPETAVALRSHAMRRKKRAIIARRRNRESEPMAALEYRLKDQFDFCLPCKVDMREQGDTQLEQLRYSRLFKLKGV